MPTHLMRRSKVKIMAAMADYCFAAQFPLLISSGGSSGRRSGDRHPLMKPFLHFSTTQMVKTRVTLPRIDLEIRFLTMTAIPSLIFWIRHCLILNIFIKCLINRLELVLYIQMEFRLNRNIEFNLSN